MRIITSEEWRTRSTPQGGRVRSGPSPGIELHHTVTGRAETAAKLAGIARAIYADHVGDRHWSDVFYGWLIGDHDILEARGWYRHSGEVSLVVVALVGDYRTGQDRLTQFQQDAVAWARGELVRKGGGDALSWHSRRASTDCPGGHVIALAEHLIRHQHAPDPGDDHAPTDNDLRDARTAQLMDQLDLRKGNVRGRHVGNLQGLLLAAGYGPAGLVGSNGRPDGIAGQKTSDALAAFQQREHLTADRVAGPLTWRKLITL
jgi:hypothetical protein